MACVAHAISHLVMICAPAAARPASVGDEGRKAASDARTAQMITRSKPQTRSLCWGSVRRKHSLPRRNRIRRDYGNLGFR